MGPKNGIMGDDFGTELPQMQLDDSQVAELQKSVRFSKTKEFQELRDYVTRRIDFYTKFLPDGTNVLTEKNDSELGMMWRSANIVIGELNAMLAQYDNAAQVVKDYAASQRKRT